MIETMLNGRIDVWWEIGILVTIGLPLWFPIFQVFMCILLKVSLFIYSTVRGGLQ